MSQYIKVSRGVSVYQGFWRCVSISRFLEVSQYIKVSRGESVYQGF